MAEMGGRGSPRHVTGLGEGLVTEGTRSTLGPSKEVPNGLASGPFTLWPSREMQGPACPKRTGHEDGAQRVACTRQGCYAA